MTRAARALASSPSSVNGGRSTGRSTESTELPATPGIAKRWLKLPPPAPADEIISPSNTARPRSSALKPSRTNSRRKRAALRIAVADDPLERGRGFAERGARRAVLEIRREVADRGQPEAGHRRTLRLVRPPRRDRRRAACPAAPSSRPQQTARRRAAAAAASHPSSCETSASRSVWPGSSAQYASAKPRSACRDRDSMWLSRTSPSTGAIGAWKVSPCGRLHVELPAEERHRESLLEQEAVSEIPRLRRQVALLRAAHDRERLIAAAIDHFEEHGAARPAGRPSA